MFLTIRKRGSQRASRPVKIAVLPNIGGQTGTDTVSFETEDGRFLTLSDFSEQEMRDLLSAVHIAHHNVEDEI